MSAFSAETARSQTFARARLTTHPDDQDTLFFLGKVDLNHVWLQLGTLGRKTGWDEYWEARRSLDRVIRMNPKHVRARVARAWVDYIVGSTVPRGVRWVLGGGNKKRGLLAVRQVAESGGGEYFDRVEARFAFWDMQVRERDIPGAVATAQLLSRDFPDNPELRRFLAIHDATARTMPRSIPQCAVPDCQETATQDGADVAASTTLTSTLRVWQRFSEPVNVPHRGNALPWSHATATRMRFRFPTMLLVGSKSIHPAPGR
jgi:hypothetical protein